MISAVALCLAWQADPSAVMRDIAARIRREFDLPSLAVAMVGPNGTYAGADGLRAIGKPDRVTVGDRYHIGSITKNMTAVLVAMLVDEGKLKWTSTLGSIFPDLQAKMSPGLAKLSVLDLLAHRSGLSGTMPRASGAWYEAPKDIVALRKRFTEAVLTEGPRRDPGTEFEYSNKNYVVAGAMIERLSGKSWEEVISERLFRPLGMRTAGFGPAGTPGKTDQPWPHRWVNDAWRAIENKPTADNPPVLGPAGRVHCSIGDLGLYARAYIEEDQILKKDSWNRLKAAVGEEDYGLGWIVVSRRWARGNALTHVGNNTMNHSKIWIAPNIGYAFIACVNADKTIKRGGKDVDVCSEATEKVIGELLKNVVGG